MNHHDALQLIKGTIGQEAQVWADLGAGTGLFTEVLCDHLPPGSEVHALDKSPHMLWKLQPDGKVPFSIHDGDFTRPMPDLPLCDGILMANALHYVEKPEEVLPIILPHLKPGGTLVLIEYETSRALPPYVPYPIPFRRWEEICGSETVPLSAPAFLHKVPSRYGHEHIYSAMSQKEGG